MIIDATATRLVSNMKTVPVVIIRGGSSKGIFLHESDLPPPGKERDQIVLRVFGSPDTRQIDGLGGGDKLTSKVAVMGPSTRADCEIDYLFGQVSQDRADIDWQSNCGNISAGAALYAALARAAPFQGDTMEIAIHQVNSGRRLLARVPMSSEEPSVDGAFAIGGVPGHAAELELDFSDFGGSALNRGVLPTGRPLDSFSVPGLGPLDVSVVDAANLHIFVRATDIGMTLTDPISVMQADGALVARLEAVRKKVSAELGFITDPDADYRLRISMNPLIYAVHAPVGYEPTGGGQVLAADYGLFSRSLSRFQFSRAYPGSGAIGTAVAAGIPGTVVCEAAGIARANQGAYSLCIGHPGGTLKAKAKVEVTTTDIKVHQANVSRTARLLLNGLGYFR
jgi:2-methylaconitate cis-trans-isomerase PrpF